MSSPNSTTKVYAPRARDLVFGQRVRHLMAQAGLNIRQIAEKLSVPMTVVSGWRQGKIPNGRNLLVLAQGLGVSMESLFNAPELPTDGAPAKFLGRDLSRIIVPSNWPSVGPDNEFLIRRMLIRTGWPFAMVMSYEDLRRLFYASLELNLEPTDEEKLCAKEQIRNEKITRLEKCRADLLLQARRYNEECEQLKLRGLRFTG